MAAPLWPPLRPRPIGPHLSAESGSPAGSRRPGAFRQESVRDHAPASLVKLATLYLACEALEAGRAQWEEPVTISRHAAETPRYRMGLRAGEEVPLRTLLEGVAIASANDAATAVAEHLGGTEEAFVESMNAKAAQLGLRSTHFANPHGLPDPAGRTTAQDMARLIGHVVQDYPASRPLLGGASFIYRGRVHSRRIPLFQDPGGVQALKTGFTRAAGYNLAIAAWREGQRFLLIVMGAQTRSLSFRDAQQLLRYGFGESGIEQPEAPRRPALPPPTRRPPDRRRRAAVRSSIPLHLKVYSPRR
jgi:D-alanyl-D-alanine carboxypeptidase (penicillin-binding protein 5/6)